MATTKKSAAKKTATKKTVTKKPAAKKSPAKKTPAKKTVSKKAVAKKQPQPLNYEYGYFFEVRMTVRVPASWDVQGFRGMSFEEYYTSQWDRNFETYFGFPKSRFQGSPSLTEWSGDMPFAEVSEEKIKGKAYKRIYMEYCATIENDNGVYECFDAPLEAVWLDAYHQAIDMFFCMFDVGNEDDPKIKEDVLRFKRETSGEIDSEWRWNNPNVEIDITTSYHIHELDTDDYYNADELPSREIKKKPAVKKSPAATAKSAKTAAKKVVAKNRDHLKKLIDEAIEKYGVNCDLNFIDVSKVTDMSDLFSWEMNARREEFNGDISQWNVSNVTNMSGMFEGSLFAGDISQWDVSNVTNMRSMFDCSQFNGDISKWDVSNVTNMSQMFSDSRFNGDIGKWRASNDTAMDGMFTDSELEQSGKLPKWYKK